MTLRRLGLALACGALLAAACRSNAPSTPARLPNDPTALPEFTLADYRHALGELRTRRSWSTCGRRGAVPAGKAPLLAAAHRTYSDRVRSIGVDILDERGSARDLMREYGWTCPSVYDPSGSIRDGLGLLGQPATLFYDASGELVDTWTGPLSEEALGSGLETILER